jgi:branched-chain amino acid transport system ATP-binding protein
VLLEITDLSIAFGGVQALSDVALAVREGSVHGLIGPNGAGKSTLLNCISRITRPNTGSIRFFGTELLGVAPHAIAGLGIARTFQNFGLIGELSVLDNVMAGMHARHPGRLIDELVLIPRRNRFERETRERALAALEFAGLSDLADRQVAQLSYGTRKAVELARASALDPRLLLLDEPTAGLNAREMELLRESLVALRTRTKIAMLVVSHHLDFLMGIIDSLTVLDLGRCIASGDPALIKSDPAVVAAYFGNED